MMSVSPGYILLSNHRTAPLSVVDTKAVNYIYKIGSLCYFDMKINVLNSIFIIRLTNADRTLQAWLLSYQAVRSIKLLTDYNACHSTTRKV